MFCCQDEPSLNDALSDPIVRTVMSADHVDPAALAVSLLETARKLGDRCRAPLERKESAVCEA